MRDAHATRRGLLWSLLATAVVLGSGERPEAAVTAALRTRKVTYPMLLDPGSATARLYGVRAVPTTFVLDRTGAIGVRVLGELDRRGLRQILAGMR